MGSLQPKNKNRCTAPKETAGRGLTWAALHKRMYASTGAIMTAFPRLDADAKTAIASAQDCESSRLQANSSKPVSRPTGSTTDVSALNTSINVGRARVSLCHTRAVSVLWYLGGTNVPTTWYASGIPRGTSAYTCVLPSSCRTFDTGRSRLMETVARVPIWIIQIE